MSGTPENGQVQETVTRRRIISAAKAAPPPNFWEYMALLKSEDWSTPGGTPHHTLYIYRDEPAPSLSLAKCTTAVFQETNTPWNDQEEMEIALMSRYGGGRYRFILKRGSERVCVHSLTIPGAPKNLSARVPDSPPPYQNYGPGPQVYPAGNGGYPNQYPNPYDPTARVAETALHTMANQDKQAVEIGISALAQAANVIKNFSAQPTAGPMDEMQRAFMAAMIQRMTMAPPDPIETFAKMMALMREANPANTGGVGGSVIDKVIAAVVERGLNPPATSSGPAVSMGAELVRILPNVAQYATEGMGNYARIMEAQRDAIAIQRGAAPQPVQVIPPRQPNPVPPPQPLPPAPVVAGAQPANGDTMLTDLMVFIERKIVEILNEPQSAEWAAEEALNFLDRMDPTIVPQLVQHGESGLMAIFQTRPTLKPALSNPARLGEFIKAFLRYANENSGDGQQAIRPN